METVKLQVFKEKCESKISHNSSVNCVYGLGMFGAAFYFLSHATGFVSGVLGVLKSIVWPAILVYEILEKLNL